MKKLRKDAPKVFPHGQRDRFTLGGRFVRKGGSKIVERSLMPFRSGRDEPPDGAGEVRSGFERQGCKNRSDETKACIFNRVAQASEDGVQFKSFQTRRKAGGGLIAGQGWLRQAVSRRAAATRLRSILRVLSSRPAGGAFAAERGLAMIVSRRASLALPFALLAVQYAEAEDSDADNLLVLVTKNGKVVIKLRPDLAPKHVAQIKALVRRKFYDGIVFHRVIEGFMAQTGDPTGTGSGGSDLPNLPAEFTDTPFKRGTVGMARSSDPDSANSQFFICFDDAPFLNGKYTVFGEVISGMDVVDKIKKGSKSDNGTVTDPDKIVKMRLASDAK
jgi:peptidylprolyl isomerase